MNRFRIQKFLGIVIILFCFSLPVKAASDRYRVLFWYPGAEGTPEQALPLLQTWTDYIAEQGGIQGSIEPVYRTDPVASGVGFLKKLKPTVAIVSLEAYQAIQTEYPVTILAQTQREPAGDGSQRYYLIHKKGNASFQTVELSEPLDPPFAEAKILAPSRFSKQHPPFHYAPQILQTLKKIGRGELPAAALINDYEWAVLKQTSLPWSQNLAVLLKSSPLPAPPLILFTDWKKSFPVKTVLQTLKVMDKNPDGKEILEALRMRGFKEPRPAAYDRFKTP